MQLLPRRTPLFSPRCLELHIGMSSLTCCYNLSSENTPSGLSLREKKVGAEMRNWGTELLGQDRQRLGAPPGASFLPLP